MALIQRNNEGLRKDLNSIQNLLEEFQPSSHISTIETLNYADDSSSSGELFIDLIFIRLFKC